MPKNLKGFIWDISILTWTVLLISAIVMVLFALLWLNARPYLDNAVAPYVIKPDPANGIIGSNGIAAINNLGNGYFLSGGDSILIFMYLIFIAGAFISAKYEGADASTLPIGIMFIVIAIIISMPLSDVGHNLLTSAQVLPATNFYKGTLYLIDNMPSIDAIATIIYLVLVVTNKKVSVPSFGGSGGGQVVGQ